MVPRGIPKRGYVGSKKDDGGFEMSLRSYDFMGNRCVEGGAKLKCMQVLITAPSPHRYAWSCASSRRR
jgi:hypothetical protein